MKWLRQRRKRKVRAAWEAGLAWFRLRYPGETGARGATRCLNLLSRPEACGRVALDYRPAEAVSALYLGVPQARVRLARQLAADFGLLLRPVGADYQPPAPASVSSASMIPGWERPFTAHLVGSSLFLGNVDDTAAGCYWPVSSLGHPGVTEAWSLPPSPPAGLLLRPSFDDSDPPAEWIAHRPDAACWPVGWTKGGVPLQLPGPLHVYGRSEAVAAWLTPMVAQTLAPVLPGAGLVVLDGAGDLVPQLKRKTAVTRRLGRELVYLDLDSPETVGGFNPLAAVPGEPEQATWQRRQRWFAGMGVHSDGLALLCQAWQVGVGDMPTLKKWLQRPARQWHGVAVSSVTAVLDRLAADRAVQNCLEWPANLFAPAAPGTLLLACAGRNFARQQLLRAAYLTVLAIPGLRLVLHGLSWEGLAAAELERPVVITNPGIADGGIGIGDTGVVLVGADEDEATLLAGRFGPDEPGEARLAENLQLLGLGEGIVLAGGRACFVSWHGRPANQRNKKWLDRNTTQNGRKA